MQCVILAGGLATRMRPHTETVPKVLLPIGDKPFAVHQIEHLRASGVDRLVYCIGYLGEQVREVLGTGTQWGVDIEYVDEGEHLKGTGGAVRLAWEQGVLEESFAVLYGDSYLPIDFRLPWVLFLKSRMQALMTVYRNGGKFDKSNAEFRNGKVFYDKKAASEGKAFEYIDYGLSFLNRDLFKEVPAAKWDLSELFHRLSQENALAGYEVHERFYEIGSPRGLEELSEHLLRPL
jgi:N-acetyl-alpha-D-muramate 1-phosphate uridylyltransferase